MTIARNLRCSSSICGHLCKLNPQLTKAGGPISREIEAITTGAGEGPNGVGATL